MNKKSFKISLYIPPSYDTSFPPLGTPIVTAFLKSKGISVFQDDLNIKFIEYIRRNKLEYIKGAKYKNTKIKNCVYYYQDLKYENKNGLKYFFEKVPGTSFAFTEKLLSSKNLLRYIDDRKENVFHKFFKREMIAIIKKEKFDMVGFSVIAPSQVIPAFTFGRIIKTEIPNVRVVMGGQWASLFKEELIKRNDFSAFYDYIIYFEGETPLYTLIDFTKSKKPLSDVPNLIYKEKNKFILSKKTSEEDMNKLPCPDFDGLPLKKYSSSIKGDTCSLTFETSRGCYWNRCIFCSDLPLPKSKYREKNIKLLIEEVKTLKHKYKVKKLTISNAVFSSWQMKKFSMELIKRKIKIKWWAWTRFEKEFTKELLHLAKKAGCSMLGFGLESISQRVLDFCGKGTKIEIIKRIIEDARDLKLPTYCQVMIGLPGETHKEVLGTIFFLLNQSKKSTFNIYYLTQKNLVFKNPGKYGINVETNPKLPFMFFYPFYHKFSNNMNKDKSRKIITIYNTLFQARHLRQSRK